MEIKFLHRSLCTSLCHPLSLALLARGPHPPKSQQGVERRGRSICLHFELCRLAWGLFSILVQCPTILLHGAGPFCILVPVRTPVTAVLLFPDTCTPSSLTAPSKGQAAARQWYFSFVPWMLSSGCREGLNQLLVTFQPYGKHLLTVKGLQKHHRWGAACWPHWAQPLRCVLGAVRVSCPQPVSALWGWLQAGGEPRCLFST